MGKEKYQKDIRNLFEKSPVVDSKSIRRIINYKKKTEYTKQAVRNLLKKGQVKRIARGFYTKHNDPSLAVFCFKPAYLGLQDALSANNLWEQETIPVIVTARKARQGIRKILGVNVLIRRINRKYLFGYDYKKEGSFYFPYSDIEKTFIDMIYFKEKLSEEAINNTRMRIDKDKLNSYLKFYSPKFRKRVLDFLKQ